MTEPTLAALCTKLDEVAKELREIRVWLVGDGQPGIFGSLRELRTELRAHLAERRGQRGGWSWSRFAFEVSRNVATVLVLAVGGWVFLAVMLQLRVSLGAQ